MNFCRPAVDPLFASAAQIWGSAILGVILTGMGSDGTHGAEDIVAAGGSVIAQDEAIQRRVGHAGRGRECRRLLGGAAARSDRAEDRAAVRGDKP